MSEVACLVGLAVALAVARVVGAGADDLAKTCNGRALLVARLDFTWVAAWKASTIVLLVREQNASNSFAEPSLVLPNCNVLRLIHFCSRYEIHRHIQQHSWNLG